MQTSASGCCSASRDCSSHCLSLDGGRRQQTVVDLFDRSAPATPDRTFVLHAGQEITYQAVRDQSCCVAAWARRQLPSAAVVAILSETSGEYVALWLGLSRASITAALVAPQLRGCSLIHALEVSKAAAVIVSQSSLGSLAAAREAASDTPFLRNLRVWVPGGVPLAHGHDEASNSLSETLMKSYQRLCWR